MNRVGRVVAAVVRQSNRHIHGGRDHGVRRLRLRDSDLRSAVVGGRCRGDRNKVGHHELTVGGYQQRVGDGTVPHRMRGIVYRDRVGDRITDIFTGIGQPIGSCDDNRATADGIHRMVYLHLIVTAEFHDGEAEALQLCHRCGGRIVGKNVAVAREQGQ